MAPDQDTKTTPLGRLIRDKRTHLGLGVGTLAGQVGVDQSYISKIELGYVQMPKWDVLNKLADELGLDVMDLVRAAGNRVDDGAADDDKTDTRPPDELPKTPRTGERIRDLRRAQDLTQKDLAMKLGVSLQAISNWETGATPRTRYLCRLAEILRTTPDDLLGRSTESIRLDDPALVDLFNALQGFSSETREHLFAMIDQLIQVVRQIEVEAEARNKAEVVDRVTADEKTKVAGKNARSKIKQMQSRQSVQMKQYIHRRGS